MSQLTPMLKQYLGIKSEYPDAVLFYRMGDFYEMFFDDARTASRVLGITLTSRGRLNGEKVPMCGVPHHSAKGYISRLIGAGLKVAVCEQTEDPKASKGIVRRDVVRLITPGSIVDEGDLDETRNLYMAAASGREGRWGLAHADLSTGEFRVTEVASLRELSDELERISPAELLLPEGGEPGRQSVPAEYRIELLDGDVFEHRRAEQLLKNQLGVHSLAGFGCEDMPEGVGAAGALAAYLKETQKATPRHIKELQTYRVGDLHVFGRRHLRASGAVADDAAPECCRVALSCAQSHGHAHGRQAFEALDDLPPYSAGCHPQPIGRGILLQRRYAAQRGCPAGTGGNLRPGAIERPHRLGKGQCQGPPFP